MNDPTKINCKKCLYYYITWDAAAPNGCKFHGFKTRLSPSIVVYQSSGMACEGYTPKGSPK